MRPPTEVAPARFEATVFEVQIPENRIADLDAQSLENQAGTAQSLVKALAEFGPTKTLYKVDQTVNLFGESITLGTSQPMVTGTRMTDSGQVNNSITYCRVVFKAGQFSAWAIGEEEHGFLLGIGRRGQHRVMAVRVETEHHLGARWFFDSQPLRPDRRAAVPCRP
jgi:hypothetical protein